MIRKSCAQRQFSKGAFIRTQAHCHNGHVGDTAGLSMTPTPRRPLLQAAACTDATLRLRRGHRRTTCRMSRSAQSPNDRTAHRRATRPDTSAPAHRSCLSLLPPTPPHAAILRALLRLESVRNDTVCGSMKIMSRTGILGSWRTHSRWNRSTAVSQILGSNYRLG